MFKGLSWSVTKKDVSCVADEDLLVSFYILYIFKILNNLVD